MKRVLLVLFSFAIFIFALPALAAQSGDFTYTESGGGATITAYTGSGVNVVIPDTLDTYPVVAIGDNSFKNLENLLSVTIPNSVVSIGNYAFDGDYSLASVTFTSGSRLTSIGNYAFRYNNLASITIPDNVTSIGGYAFYGSYSLTSISLDSYLTSIGTYAFAYSTLTSIIIPDSVTSIGKSAFTQNSLLTSVTLGRGLTLIDESVFNYCGLTSINIPDNIISIGNSAFYHNSALKSVILGRNITSIGVYAFKYTDLTSITIPDSVTLISSGAFSYNPHLTSANFLGKATSVGMGGNFDSASSSFSIYYSTSSTTNFTTPTWKGYAATSSPKIDSLLADREALTGDSIKGVNFDISHITTVLANPLPSSGANGSAITWTSNNTSLISNNGQTVNRPIGGNATTILTATISNGTVVSTKAFSLVVLSQPGLLVVTNPATTINQTMATLNGTMTDTDGDIISARGFEYGLTTTYTATTTDTGVFIAGVFSKDINTLTCNTTYHYRAYAENGTGTSYGTDQTFLTSVCPSVVTTTAATAINQTTATLNGAVTDTGGDVISARGFEYGLTTTYTATTTETGTFGASIFSKDINTLTCNTTYHYRAYAENGTGTSYGTDQTFLTSVCPVVLSSVSSAPVSLPAAISSTDNTVSIPMNSSSDIGTISSGGVSILSYINSKATFVTPQNNESHSLTISSLDLYTNIITLTIASTPQTVTMQKGETKPVDLNSDGINDIEVTFANVYINRAEITVKTLNVEKPISNTESFVAQESKLCTKANTTLIKRLAGRILLQVETKGQAWYLDNVSLKRYYLADGPGAYQALRKFGLGITNTDLAKIPVASTSILPSGYVKSTIYSSSLTEKLKGRIVLQVENHGEAWYINPADGKRYYLANGEAAYQIMRNLSLGITNSDLHNITVG